MRQVEVEAGRAVEQAWFAVRAGRKQQGAWLCANVPGQGVAQCAVRGDIALAQTIEAKGCSARAFGVGQDRHIARISVEIDFDDRDAARRLRHDDIIVRIHRLGLFRQFFTIDASGSA
jgi:hypothetical protein